MKKQLTCLILVIALLSFYSFANARVWDNSTSDGSVTVGPTSPEGYTTLKQCADAFNAVSGGVNANWEINIQESGSPYIETVSVCFANTITSGRVVTLKPESGGTSVTLSFSQSGSQIINGGLILGATDPNDANSVVAMNGFVIDGSNNGTSSRNLTLMNASQGVYRTHPVIVWGGSSGGVIKNCIIINNCTYDAYADNDPFVACILLSGRQTVSGEAIYEPNDWTIHNCALTAMNGAMGSGIDCNRTLAGTNLSGSSISNLAITSNTITASQCGIHLAHNNAATVTSNRIRMNEQIPRYTVGTSNPGTKTPSIVRAIFHDSAPGVNISGASNTWTMTISENVIDQVIYAGAVDETGIRVIDLSNAPTNGTPKYNVFNNMVSGVSLTGAVSGVRMVCATFYSEANGCTLNIYHNSFNMPNAGVFSTADGTLSWSREYNRVGGVVLTQNGPIANVKNNIIRMVQDTGRAIYKGGTDAAARCNSNGNVVWINSSGTSQRVGRLDTTEYTSWAEWQGTGKDANGHNVDPAATSGSRWTSATATDLHFVPADITPVGVDGIAGLYPNVPTDIDGQARSSFHPTAGADEVISPWNSAVGWTKYE
jgi:hypothetical protein